jgi:FKBP-type peptidyl-prolyl cis-trans isomerase (trigger factor)
VEEPVERLAQEGDMVTAKISGEKLVEEDDQDKILFSETTRELLIRATDNNEKYEWPFKGFSRNCIGLRAGEGKTVTYTYSGDYEVSSLQGVEARFDFVIDQVRSRRLP